MATILVIDDESNIRKLLAKILSKDGHEVAVAEDGKVGLEICQMFSFDLIITDIIMPEVEGLEVIQQLKQSQPKVKIIAMSGGGHLSPQDYLEMAETLGAAATISKPFTKQEVVAAIDAVLGS